MTNITVTNYDPAAKQLYRESNLRKSVLSKRPFLGLVNKNESFGGAQASARGMPIINVYGDPQGIGATIALSQTAQTEVKMKAFQLIIARKYATAKIDGEVIETTVDDKMAFLSALKAKYDGAINGLSNAIETALFRGANGMICKYSAASFANPMVLTLSSSKDAQNFEVGMILTAHATDGGAALATPATNAITAINRQAGTLTVTLDTSGGAGTTDWENTLPGWIARSGDLNASWAGLDAWCPATAPDATTFFNVDRTADSRLYGQIYDGSLVKVEDALQEAAMLAGSEEAECDLVLMNHAQYRKLIGELGSKKEYCEDSGVGPKGMVAGVGFTGVYVHGPMGPIKVYAANRCPSATAYMLTKSAWTFHTVGAAPKFLMGDGLKLLRSTTTDDYESRLVARGNLGCTAPNWNVNIALAAVA